MPFVLLFMIWKLHSEVVEKRNSRSGRIRNEVGINSRCQTGSSPRYSNLSSPKSSIIINSPASTFTANRVQSDDTMSVLYPIQRNIANSSNEFGWGKLEGILYGGTKCERVTEDSK
jgi:hypothetical protein